MGPSRRTRIEALATGLLTGAAALCLGAPRAAACVTLAPPPALVGYPKDGATEVPTDVVPVFDSFRPLNWSALELTEEGGTKIPLTSRQVAAWHMALVPSTPLAPRTRYTLGPAGGGTTSVPPAITFVTGDGPVSAPPPPPQATIQHYARAGNTFSSCDISPHGTCLSHPTDGFVEWLFLDLMNDPSIYDGTVGSQGPYLVGSSGWTNLSGIDQGNQEKCVRLRTRAANGTFSEPVALCGQDAQTYQYPEGAKITCTANGLVPLGTPSGSGGDSGGGSGGDNGGGSGGDNGGGSAGSGGGSVVVGSGGAGGGSVVVVSGSGGSGSGGGGARLTGRSDGPPTCAVSDAAPRGRWTWLALAGALLLSRTRSRRSGSRGSGPRG